LLRPQNHFFILVLKEGQWYVRIIVGMKKFGGKIKYA
jgi:hypothetical protein